MPTLKEYNLKIARLRSTRKMTKTMKMISANKLRKAQEAQKRAGEYTERLNAVIGRIAASADEVQHPLMQVRPQVSGTLVLLITSDRGLCGGFNNNLNKRVFRWMQEHAGRLGSLAMSFCGRRGITYFKTRNRVTRKHFEGVTAKPCYEDAMRIGADLQEAFLSGSVDEVYIAYNHSKSVMSHVPTIEKLLPVDTRGFVQKLAGTAESTNWILEPEGASLLASLVPRYVNMKIYTSLLSNSEGEHGARMTAMDSATRNADTIIDDTTLQRNRARQWKITTELVEIVAGAEALK